MKNYSGQFPFRLLSNNDLSVFMAYRCHDDFEGKPLHGTFLIGADGRELWHDIGAEPFMEVDFLLKEAPRLIKLHTRPVVTPNEGTSSAGE